MGEDLVWQAREMPQQGRVSWGMIGHENARRHKRKNVAIRVLGFLCFFVFLVANSLGKKEKPRIERMTRMGLAGGRGSCRDSWGMGGHEKRKKTQKGRVGPGRIGVRGSLRFDHLLAKVATDARVYLGLRDCAGSVSLSLLDAGLQLRIGE